MQSNCSAIISHFMIPIVFYGLKQKVVVKSYVLVLRTYFVVVLQWTVLFSAVFLVFCCRVNEKNKNQKKVVSSFVSELLMWIFGEYSTGVTNSCTCLRVPQSRLHSQQFNGHLTSFSISEQETLNRPSVHFFPYTAPPLFLSH